jgi:hypothetical protein
MRNILVCIAGILIAPAAVAEREIPGVFQTADFTGWTVTRGAVGSRPDLQAKDGGSAHLQTAEPLPLPIEAAFRFRADIGDKLIAAAQAVATNQTTPPLLWAYVQLNGANRAQVGAKSSGQPMATSTISDRTWTRVSQNDGWLSYQWRFLRVKNLWDDRDRAEIGTAFAALTPFQEKIFSLRLVLTRTGRQIWLDDRLVAEDRAANPPLVRFTLQLEGTARVLSAEFRRPAETGPYLPLALTAYSHLRAAPPVQPVCDLIRLAGDVPLLVPQTPWPDIDLGQSLFRYRLAHGTGPDAGYVNALVAWPAAFHIDPASLTFRVPYRHYQNVWLLAWLDERPHSVPRGAVQFFREDAGYPARTDFEITAAAVEKGLVTKLARRTAEGRQLYLVKVPVDTAGLYGLRDLADQFLDFELTKPLALTRSYPDPIYYGYHPAGRPSAVHVVGITLEEAPFGFDVKPSQTHFVFESPEKPAFAISVTNTTPAAFRAVVRAATHSYDGEEKHADKGKTTVKPGAAGDVELSFALNKMGWHRLNVEVEVNGVRRHAALSLVLLPPNARSYGYAPNETRFGTWCLNGHYTADRAGDFARNEPIYAMYRKLGLRRTGLHEAFVTVPLAKKYDFLPTGPHTVGRNFASWNMGGADPAARSNAIAAEVAAVAKLAKDFPDPTYYYGGEWGISEQAQYAPWPLYTGAGDRPLDDEARKNAATQVEIFTAIGQAIRAKYPTAKLILQWGAPAGSLAHLRAGIGRDVVDGLGMDAPMFELLPELSNITGSINSLWMVRAEAQRLGWPRLPISWCEGPFFPTTPGALTERDQMDYQIRYLLLALAYGVDQFESGVVPQDAGNYYGAEHYGAGVFHRTPLDHPKPAVAAIATLTTMLCGADVVGPVDTGCLTTYCLAFRRAKDQRLIFALWRVNGSCETTLKVRGNQPIVTDAMGNARACRTKDGAFTVALTCSPVWLTGIDGIEAFAFAAPRYSEAPATIARPLAGMTAEQWTYDGGADPAYASNHFAICRITDPNLKVEFGQAESEHPDALAVTLSVEPGDRPLATRYGQLKPKQPVAIPGKAGALGIWIKGNSSWGRVVYQCRDAKGEIWTSVGTKDDWNCDDTHAWSYVSFEGWRYVRFPLPGSQPWDGARDLEMTWWGCRAGDGIVDLPLTLEKIVVEARNEVPYLGDMKLVPNRSYKLAGLVAEYETEENASGTVVAQNQLRQPQPVWSGPSENPIAKLMVDGAGPAPTLKGFEEPTHFNDGRRMVIRFDAAEGFTGNLYLSRFPDGRGAELFAGGLKDGATVVGFRPAIPVYLFLTAVGKDKKESQPSAACALVTQDKFSEK